MSVIQTLRDKYATVVVVVVCISLVAFLLMDAFVGPKSFFKQDTEVVTVNGVGYQYQDFMQAVQVAENNFRTGNPQARMTDEIRNRLKNGVYTQFVQDQILQQEYEELGIAFSPEELRMLTVTTDAAPQIQQIPGFQNPQTGAFDPNRVVQFIQNLRSAPANNQQAQMQRQQWIQMEEFLKNNALVTKFVSLVSNGIYVPKWLAEETAGENNRFSNISFVAASYTTIPDSAVKVTTEELQQYLNEHEKLYQVEASRSIEYVSFEAVPSAEDSANILSNIAELKKQFDTLGKEEISGFLSRNSETPFVNRYIPESMLQSSVKETLLALPEGAIYGPYFENGLVAYAKKIGSKQIADSVVIQQLLISNQLVPDSVARFRVDSIETAVGGGADFAAMVQQYSNAQTENGGEMVLTPDNPNIPDEFMQFVYDHQAGDVGVVKTQYGYHLIKINEKTNKEQGYKIGYLTAAMTPSQKTDNAIFSQANRFRGLNQTREEFEKTAKEKGYNIQVANDIQSDAFSVGNLPASREIIHWAFNAELNDLSKVFVLPNQYVVAVLTGVTEEGTAELADVRPQIEAIVRRDKKAEKIARKMKGGSLEAIASAVKDSVSVGQHIGFATPFIPNYGFEPKVVGASFNKAWTEGKISTPVFGNNGVYVLTIDSLQQASQDSTSLAQVKTQVHSLLERQFGFNQLMTVLTKEADIEDRRIKFPGL